MTKPKQIFLFYYFGKFIENAIQKYLIYIGRPFDMRFEIELRCILFLLITIKIFYKMIGVNSIDWT
jgi:hypothetical protein